MTRRQRPGIATWSADVLALVPPPVLQEPRQEAEPWQDRNPRQLPPILLRNTSKAIAWTAEAKEAITQHLGLNIRTDPKKCQRALDVLARVLTDA